MMYLHCKELKKEEQNKFKVGKWKEIIKIRIETNEIEIPRKHLMQRWAQKRTKSV